MIKKEFDEIYNFIIGLGGRDITEETMGKIINVLIDSKLNDDNTKKLD